MIDHETARRLAATAIDFPLDADERTAYDQHVDSCTACRAREAGLRRDSAMLRDLDLGPVPIAVRAHVAIAAERQGTGLSSRWVTLAAAAVLLIAALGASVFIGVGSGDGLGAALVGRPVHWTTEVVDLVADDLWIEAAGRQFIPPPDREIKVASDPGDRSRWTLEVVWFDDGIEMRINLYFVSDGTRWWVDETRIYDGRVPGDWITTGAPVAEAPLGAGFAGDIVVQLAESKGERGGTGRLVMRGLRLATNPQDIDAPQPGMPVNKPVPRDEVLKPAVPGGPILVPIPRDVTCGPMPAAKCDAFVLELLAMAATEYPGRQVVAIEITSLAGAYTLHFDDGTEVGADVN